MPSTFDAAAWWPLLFLLLVLVTTRRVFAARALRSLVFRPARREPMEWESLPLYLRERVDAMHPGLAEAGFIPVGGERAELCGGFVPAWQWRWLHSASGTTVDLRVNDVDPPSLGADLWFIDTAFADGSGVSTTNEPLVDYVPKSNPRWQTEHRVGEELAALWARHAERVQARAAASGVEPLTLTPEEASIILRGRDEGVWEAFRSASDQFTEKPEGLRLRWSWILRHGFALVVREQKALRAREKARQRALAAPAAPEVTDFSYSEEARDALDLNVFHLMEAAKRARRLSPRGRATLTLASLIVFVVLLSLWRGDWKWAAIISGVLVFHEAGHWIAMRIFGSRNTSMLFIPFFGGAAIQHDRPNLKPWHHAVILLAGPLPGLVIGLALAAWAVLRPVPAWVEDTALIAVVLNAFNLLVPVMPLDGGQLVNIALFSRAPQLAVLFKAVSGIALIACSIWLGLGALLWLPGVAFLIRVPLEWRTAAVHRELRREAKANPLPAHASEDDWLRRIFRRLRGPGLAGLRSFARYMEALRLVMLVRHPGAGLGTVLFALAGWLAPLWLPVIGLWFVQWQGARDLARMEEEARAVNLPRPAGVRRERVERARTLPPDKNAAELITRTESRWREREALYEKRRSHTGAMSPAAPEDLNRIRTIEREIFALIELASQRPALGFPADDNDIPNMRANGFSFRAGRIESLRNTTYFLSSGAAVNLKAGSFPGAIRQLESAVRIASLLSASAEPYPGRSASLLLDQCFAELEPALNELAPSAEAVAAVDRLAAVLPGAEWMRRSFLGTAPRDRAWQEAELFEPIAGPPPMAMSGLGDLLRPFALQGEASPLSDAQRARFVSDSLRIQASATDPAQPWGWDPEARRGIWDGSPKAFTGASAGLWRRLREDQLRMAARAELARSALAWHRARLGPGGVAPARGEDLRAPFLAAPSNHPTTGEPVRLERTAGQCQLAFRSYPAVTWQLLASGAAAEKKQR